VKKNVLTAEIIDKVHDYVLKDWRKMMRKMVDGVRISEKGVRLIWLDELGVFHIRERWVPH